MHVQLSCLLGIAAHDVNAREVFARDPRQKDKLELVVRGFEVTRQAAEILHLAQTKRAHESLLHLRLAHFPPVVYVVKDHLLGGGLVGGCRAGGAADTPAAGCQLLSRRRRSRRRGISLGRLLLLLLPLLMDVRSSPHSQASTCLVFQTPLTMPMSDRTEHVHTLS